MKSSLSKQKEEILSLLDLLDIRGKEKDIYVLCLNNGPLPASIIAKMVNVHRVTVYQIINQLLKRGLLNREKNMKSGKIQLFNACDLEKLQDLLNQQKRRIDSLQKHLSTLLKQKKNLYKDDRPTIKTFNDHYSLKQTFIDAINISKKNIFLVSPADSPLNIFDNNFLNDFLKNLNKNKIKLKIIIPSNNNILNNQKNLWLRKGIEYRIFKSEQFPFGSGILISDLFIFLFSWNPEDYKGIKITDETIRQTYMALFLLLWEKFSLANEEKNPKQNIFDNSMKIIPAGVFHFSDGMNSKKIFINAFLIDETTVTNDEYYVFIKETGYPAPAHWKDNIYPRNKASHPIVGVSLIDARAYAIWAKKRLPTDEEWEKAAKGNDQRIYPWGNTFNIKFCNILRINGDTTPVKSYPLGRNYYGLYDMAGNVWEWTETLADEEKKLYILKGGSWSNNETTAQCTYKTMECGEKSYDNIGFRCVKDIP